MLIIMHTLHLFIVSYEKIGRMLSEWVIRSSEAPSLLVHKALMGIP